MITKQRVSDVQFLQQGAAKRRVSVLLMSVCIAAQVLV